MRKAAADLRASLANADPDALTGAVEAEARRRMAAFARGVARYRTVARPGRPPEPPTLWRAGTTRLLDYGAVPEAADGKGPPVLVIPSLVNRATILDLLPERSFLRALAARGLRPMLVDWDGPGPEERRFGVDAYVTERLRPALAYVTEDAGRPAAVMGYCMGGTLGVALAALEPERTAALALIATPWDFHANNEAQTRSLAAMLPAIEALVRSLGVLPVDVLQAMFVSLDPWLAATKFRRFADADPASPEARLFVALEDWLNDGVPLAGPAAVDCLRGWYVENRPGRGAWTIDGTAVEPSAIAAPSFAAIPARDHIVPPASAEPLAGALPRCRRIRPDAGHIGMVAGGRADGHLTGPLADWLLDVLG